MTADLSVETKELAWELQQKKPDSHRVKWLLENADLAEAMRQANVRREDLRKPELIHLQKQLDAKLSH